MISELLTSVRQFRSPKDIALVVLDCGLTAAQADQLATRHDARVFKPERGYEIAPSKIRGREYLKALTARTFLDVHCPESDLIAWLDADTWVQDVSALDMLFDATADGKLAVVTHGSRYARKAMQIRWRLWGMASVKSSLYKNARRARVPERDARVIGVMHSLNAGVFALRRDAPSWQSWRRRQAQVIRRGRLFTADQLALSMVVHLDRLPVALMPEICNYFGPWKCQLDAPSGAGGGTRGVPSAVRPSGYCAISQRERHED